MSAFAGRRSCDSKYSHCTESEPSQWPAYYIDLIASETMRPGQKLHLDTTVVAQRDRGSTPLTSKLLVMSDLSHWR
jgi:hypothetical protein